MTAAINRLDLDWALGELNRCGVSPEQEARIRDAVALPLEDNPLFAAWRAIVGPDAPYDLLSHGGPLCAHMIRRPLVTRFSWAVPSPEALDVICKVAAHCGVNEVGAGNGYWAALLALRGVEVAASDGVGRHDNSYVAANHPVFHPISTEPAPSAARRHPKRALLLVWPSYDKNWAGEAVNAYHEAGGSTVIYVGEGRGGCTGDDYLHDLLGDIDDFEDSLHEALFRPIEELAVPQWDGIHDRLTIHTRISPPPAEEQAEPTAEDDEDFYDYFYGDA